MEKFLISIIMLLIPVIGIFFMFWISYIMFEDDNCRIKKFPGFEWLNKRV